MTRKELDVHRKMILASATIIGRASDAWENGETAYALSVLGELRAVPGMTAKWYAACYSYVIGDGPHDGVDVPASINTAFNQES